MIDLRRHRRGILVAYLIGVLALTIAPIYNPTSVSLPATPKAFDKVVHFVLFGGMALLLLWNLRSPARAMLLIAVSITAGFAGLIELLQAPLAYRSAGVWDFVAGTAGALVSAGLVAAIAGYGRGSEDGS